MFENLDENLKPTLFIDGECSICVDLSQRLKRFDEANNIKIQSLADVVHEGPGHLQALAKSKTTMIFAEPRIQNTGLAEGFMYSTKGRALFRLLRYLPAPLRWIAVFEKVPGASAMADGFYILFAKIRRYL